MKEKTREKKEEDKYDFIIIGAGVSGLAAAMYGARLGMKTLCLGASHGSEMPIGGVITTTNIMENYPGFIKISGFELAEKIKEEKALDVIKKDKNFIVKTKEGEYLGKVILFATGTMWRKLDVKGGKDFENRGISYCAICDGPLYRNKIVAIVGGSDSAIKEALILAEHAKKVYVIYRGENVRAEPINLEQVEKSEKIEIINKANVVEVKGKDFVESVILDREFNGSKELKLNGVFVAIGHVVLSGLAKNLGVNVSEKGEIIINHKTGETNIAGVYAAGDVTDKQFKQAITGVADGCTAAYSAFEFSKKKGIYLAV